MSEADHMYVGERLRRLREEKKLSQGDIQKRTGLVRPYISRVENGHVVPSLETLEKFARALEVPLFALFYEGEELPAPPDLAERRTGSETVWGSHGKGARMLGKLCRSLARMDAADRRLLLLLVQKMAYRKRTS
jgi:transcriptional regulator with XRE-family HTH domain